MRSEADYNVGTIRILRNLHEMDSFHSCYELLVSVNERLKNFRILRSQDNMTFTQDYQDQSNGSTDPPQIIEPGLNPDVLARFVKIDLQGTNRVLSLCEVEVFGDCVDGRYGDCNKTCDTCLGKKCDKLTGDCIECVPGYYGGKCDKSCNSCQNGDCDKLTGRCHSCEAGKQGDFCQTDCVDHYYGNNCSQQCGRCLDGDSCDKVDGHCPKGCQNGWKGARCLQECDVYFYGNCSIPCGYCADGKPCNKVNGSCDEDGCANGWQTAKCDRRSSMIQQTVDTGANAGVIAGPVVAVVGVVIITAVIIVVMVKLRRRRERNTTTTDRSTNNNNLAVVNAERPIENIENTYLENPRTYYNIEESNQTQSESINKTNSDDIVESDVKSYNHYEKLKHTTGAAESAYSAIDQFQSGRHKELTYGAKLNESNTYYNMEQSTTGAKKESYEMSGNISQNEASVNSDNYYEKVQGRPSC